MSNCTEYSLKLASKPLQRTTLVLLLVFLATLPVMDVPMTDFSFPSHFTYLAKVLAQISLIMCLVAVVVFSFYRNRVKFTLDENGIYLPEGHFIAWKSIRWFRVDQNSSNSGIRRVVLKLDKDKIVLLVDNDEVLYRLEEDLTQKLRLYNPLAKDFRELKSSKIKAIILILMFTALHVAIIIYTNFDKKYIIIFTPVLFISISAILVEHIKN